MYAEHKQLALGWISVDVSHAKVHARDCAERSDEQRASNVYIDRFERVVAVEGELTPELKAANSLVDRKPSPRDLTTVAGSGACVRRHCPQIHAWSTGNA